MSLINNIACKSSQISCGIENIVYDIREQKDAEWVPVLPLDAVDGGDDDGNMAALDDRLTDVAGVTLHNM